jgi:sugar lactone lactonase YvrE
VTSSLRTLAPLAHCEGIAAGADGTLWTGDEDGRLFRIDPADGSFEQVATIEGWALGLCVDGDGLVYVCAYDRGSIVRVDPASGTAETYAEGLGFPNWPVLAADGTLYVSDSGSEEPGAVAGRVLAIPPGGGTAEPLPLRPLAFANGMALATDGTLYVAESHEPGVVAVRNGETTMHAELPGTVPDGLALDDEGGMIVTSYQPNRVLRVPPGGGEPEVVVEDWTGQTLMTPTNAAYFGPDRSSLAIAQLCAWSILAIDTPWRGQPLFYPSIR